MTVEEWLASLDPAPPPELAAAMRESLDGVSAHELVHAAQRTLSHVLNTECARRDAALDLLTADALVTHALDLALDDQTEAAIAKLIMERLNDIARETLPLE